MTTSKGLLRKWREAKGWTVRKAAYEVGIHRGTFERAELGASLTVETLQRITKRTGISLADLVADRDGGA